MKDVPESPSSGEEKQLGLDDQVKMNDQNFSSESDKKEEDDIVNLVNKLTLLSGGGSGHEAETSSDDNILEERLKEPEEDEEEEVIIKSIEKPEDEEDCGENYTSKGPISRRLLVSHRPAPYSSPAAEAAALVKRHPSSSQDQLLPHSSQLGVFVDISTLLEEAVSPLLIIRGEETTKQPFGKKGIPALPDTSGPAGSGSGGPRILFRNLYGRISSLPAPLQIVLDPRLKKMGIWLPRQVLPQEAVRLPEVVGGDAAAAATTTLELFLQLNLGLTRAVRFTSSVRRSVDKLGNSVAVLLAQFVELRPFYSDLCTTGVAGLLEGVKEKEIEDALSLVRGKDLTDLLKTYGPNQDSMLMSFCCKKDEPATIRAQVFALTSRILAQTDPKMRSNVVQKNACGLSALDYTAVTNNRRIATFLVDLYYVMGADPTCVDASGNSLLHVMSRKGDAAAPMLQALLSLRYTHNTTQKVYSSNARNQKAYLPIHHAATSRQCPQRVIQILQKDLAACLTASTLNGSLPIHLACQYSTDPTMLATLLQYNRDVVNRGRGDGLTPLHLVASRNDAADSSVGLIPLDEDTQVRMIRLLLYHGADKELKVEEKYSPYDLVKVDRERSRELLCLKSRCVTAHSTVGMYNICSPPTAPGILMHETLNQSPTGSSSSYFCESPSAAPPAMVNNNNNNGATAAASSSLSPERTASQISPQSYGFLGSNDPFIGGNFLDNLSPQSGSGGSGGSPYGCNNKANVTSSEEASSSFLNNFSDGGSNSDSGSDYVADLLLNSLGGVTDMEREHVTRDENSIKGGDNVAETDLDMIAMALYDHPTIQAVINTENCI